VQSSPVWGHQPPCFPFLPLPFLSVPLEVGSPLLRLGNLEGRYCWQVDVAASGPRIGRNLRKWKATYLRNSANTLAHWYLGVKLSGEGTCLKCLTGMTPLVSTHPCGQSSIGETYTDLIPVCMALFMSFDPNDEQKRQKRKVHSWPL